ncbi:MAG: adenosylcobinamide-phosphate synthase CbiB [Alphaproteobacteria bacterium]|nr:adenosylcobinamide-phosphate synthase CbiB [Alphaproteobacteria bacterium]
MAFLYQTILPLSAALVKFRLLVLVVAAVLDHFFGRPQLWERLPHPVVGIGKIISLCDRLGNRESESNRWRFFSGLVTVALVLGVTMAAALVLAWLSLLPFGWGLEVLVVAVFLAMRNLTDHCLAVYRALPDLPAARRAVARIVGRDPEQLDEFAIARAATESLAENYSDGVIAPVFWYLLGGMVGMVGYKAINSLDSMIGHHSTRYEYFGKAAARLDDAVNWLPARLTGLILVWSAGLQTGASLRNGWSCLWREGRNHRSPNAGYPEAAVAGALGLALSGPRWYHGERQDEPWLGRSGKLKGREAVTRRDLQQAIELVNGSWQLLLVAGMVALLLWR